MNALSPIWLLGLAPWLAVTIWLLWGRSRHASVPFLALWRGPVAAPRARPRLQKPPVAVLAALLGALLAILAAARPCLPQRSGSEPALSLIVDRGLSMSAGRADDLRFRRTVRDAWPALARRFRGRTVELVSLPGFSSRLIGFDACPDLIRQMPASSLNTAADLRAAVRRRLENSGRPIVVITDQSVDSPGGRVVRITPQDPVRNVGVAGLTVEERPSAQAMITLHNQSELTDVELAVSSAGRTVVRRVGLPERGGTKNYFFDLPALGPTVEARLQVRDDVPADDRTWLVREGSSPRIEPTAPLPPELRRMIESYQRSRPASDASYRLCVLSDVGKLPADAPAVALAPPKLSVTGTPNWVVDHPVTRHVRWERLPVPLHWAGDPPAGWRPLVSMGDRTLVAVRPGPPRQVWVGFDAPRWGVTPDFVVFWTNVFDWAGGGGQSFAGHRLEEWTADWKPLEASSQPGVLSPGIFKRADGVERAFNAGGISSSPPADADWQKSLDALVSNGDQTDLAGWLFAAAAGCLVLTAWSWQRDFRPRTQGENGPPVAHRSRRVAL